jgi:hypothetical protein
VQEQGDHEGNVGPGFDVEGRFVGWVAGLEGCGRVGVDVYCGDGGCVGEELGGEGCGEAGWVRVVRQEPAGE